MYLEKQRAIRSYQHLDFECGSEQHKAQTPRPPADWSEQSVNTITSKGPSGHFAADNRPVVGWKLPRPVTVEAALFHRTRRAASFKLDNHGTI